MSHRLNYLIFLWWSFTKSKTKNEERESVCELWERESCSLPLGHKMRCERGCLHLKCRHTHTHAHFSEWLWDDIFILCVDRISKESTKVIVVVWLTRLTQVFIEGPTNNQYENVYFKLFCFLQFSGIRLRRYLLFQTYNLYKEIYTIHYWQYIRQIAIEDKGIGTKCNCLW